MNFAERLRFLREKAGLSQASLAAKVGIKPNAYNKIETRGTQPGPAMLKELAKALGCSLDDLVGYVAPAEKEDRVKEKLLKQVELLQQKSQDPSISADSLAKLTNAMVSVSVVLLGGNQSPGEALSYHPSLAVLSVEDLTDLYAGRALRQRRSQGVAQRTE